MSQKYQGKRKLGKKDHKYYNKKRKNIKNKTKEEK